MYEWNEPLSHKQIGTVGARPVPSSRNRPDTGVEL